MWFYVGWGLGGVIVVLLMEAVRTSPGLQCFLLNDKTIGWATAIGTVTAVFVAVLFPILTRRREKRERQERIDQRSRTLAKRMRLIMLHIQAEAEGRYRVARDVSWTKMNAEQLQLVLLTVRPPDGAKMIRDLGHELGEIDPTLESLVADFVASTDFYGQTISHLTEVAKHTDGDSQPKGFENAAMIAREVSATAWALFVYVSELLGEPRPDPANFRREAAAAAASPDGVGDGSEAKAGHGESGS